MVPALTLLAPLLVSAASRCYLVTNTRIEIIPCKFDPESIAAQVAELEKSEPGGPAAATPRGSTPRVQARDRPQGAATGARGREQAPSPDREATARGSNLEDLRTQHAASSSGPQQPATPQPGAQGAQPQSPAAAQSPPRGTELQQPEAPDAARPSPEPGPSAAPRGSAAASQPSSPPQSSSTPQPLSSTQPSSASGPSAPSQAVSRGAEAQQAVDATVAELRSIEGALASGATGEAGAVLARAAQAFATASSLQAAAAITTAQQALARGDLYATRQAIAGAIAAATRR